MINVVTENRDVEHKHNFYLGSTRQATCVAMGYEFWKCATCGATKTVRIPALGHEYEYTTKRVFEKGIHLERSVRKC